MKRYIRIDLCRLICALLVVMIHCVNVFEGHRFAQMIVECFSQQAVPFFFMASGFFFAKKLDAAEQKTTVIRNFVVHNFLLYMAWMVVEFPELVHNYQVLYPDSSVFGHALHIFRRVLFVGWDVYWYLLVLAEAALVTGIFVACKKETWMYVLAGAGLLAGVIFDANVKVQPFAMMNDLLFLIFSWNNNIVMKGLPYMAIGVWFARNEQITRIPEKAPIIAYVVISIVRVTLFWINLRHRIGWLRFVNLTAIQAVLLFFIALYPSRMVKERRTASNCRDLSTCIFFVHNISIQYIANILWPIDSPTLLRFTVAVIPGILVWALVRNSNLKPVKWMLSMR